MAKRTADRPASARSIYRAASKIILAGIAVIVPLVVTVYVLQIALEFLANTLTPVVQLLELLGVVDFLQDVGLVMLLIELGVYADVIGFLTELIAIVTLLALVVCVGSIAYHPRGERLVGYFDFVIASIPGIGTVYKSFRRMGDIILDDEIANFQEVKLVELLNANHYVIGFTVDRAPPAVREAVDEEDMLTMFLPLAPNPITGGYLAYVPASRTTDVDMTVEEGIRSIITSGIAGRDDDHSIDLSLADVHDLLSDESPSETVLVDPVSTDRSPEGDDESTEEARADP